MADQEPINAAEIEKLMEGHQEKDPLPAPVVEMIFKLYEKIVEIVKLAGRGVKALTSSQEGSQAYMVYLLCRDLRQARRSSAWQDVLDMIEESQYGCDLAGQKLGCGYADLVNEIRARAAKELGQGGTGV